jgi:uncharacterized protein
MKLQPDAIQGLHINAHGVGWVAVNGQRYAQAILVSSLPGSSVQAWGPADFESLCAQDFAPLAHSGADMVIFGSGTHLRFPPPAWLAPFMQNRMGFDSMDTAAACRTYNILAGEGRKVLAALLVNA